MQEHGFESCQAALEEIYMEEKNNRSLLGGSQRGKMSLADTLNEFQREDDFQKILQIDHGIVDASAHPLFAVTSSGILQRVNTKALHVFGYNHEEELTGRPLSALMVKDLDDYDTDAEDEDDGGDNDSDISEASLDLGGGFDDEDAAVVRFMRQFELTGTSHAFGKKYKMIATRMDKTKVTVQLSFQALQITKPGSKALLRSKSGKRKFHVRSNAKELYFCGFVRLCTSEGEVTSDMYQHAKSMEAERNMFQQMIDASFDACFVINDRGIIQKVNTAGLRKFGYSREDQLLNQNIKIICGDAYRPHHDKWLENYRRTRQHNVIGSQQREVRAKRKDGSEVRRFGVFRCLWRAWQPWYDR